MKRRYLITCFIGLISGLAVSAVKPDFAFPATVSSAAQQQIKNALHRGDDVAALRAMTDWSLAEMLRNPDAVAKVDGKLAEYQPELRTDAARGLTLVLRGSLTDSTKYFVEALSRYRVPLQQARSAQWRSVIDADTTYLPTLYDFAVARSNPGDSLLAEMRRFHAGEPAPLAYWTLRNPQADTSDALNLYQANPQEAYPLLWMGERAHSVERRRQVYDLAVTHTPRWRVDTLIDKMTQPEITLQARNINVPDSLLQISVTSICARDGAVRVTRTAPSRSEVATIPLHFAGEGVFQADTTVSIALPDYGEYLLTPIVGSGDEPARSGVQVAVTSIMLVAEDANGTKNVFPLDPIGGEELQGVQITQNRNQVSARRGADCYTPSVWNGAISRRPARRVAAQVLTDRSIYHPGDTLHFAAVVYGYDLTGRSLCCDTTLTATLRDAGHKPVCTVEITTDAYGRAQGAMAIPSDGMTGRFSLVVGQNGTARVMVSDYVAPTFEATAVVELTPDSMMQVSGKAVGYNGFPQADAQVEVSLFSIARGVWWRHGSVASEQLPLKFSAKTASDGTFSLTVPIPEAKNLLVRTTVTSVLGESRDCENFLPVKPYFITAEIPENELVDGATPQISVVDARGAVANLPLTVTLDGKPVEQWSGVPSGRYCLKAFVADSCLADTLTIDRLTVYRLNDERPPYSTPLWVPRRRLTAGEPLLVGSTNAASRVRCTVWSADSILSQRWISLSQGNHWLDITDLPDGIDEAKIQLWTLHDYQRTICTVNVIRPVARELQLDVTGFRESAQPGAVERRTIRVTDNLGRPVKAALMLDIYAKALDALSPHQLSLNLAKAYFNPYISRSNNASLLRSTAVNGVNFSGVPDVGGDFDLYGESWRRTRNLSYRMQRATANLMSVDVEEDAVADSGEILGEEDAEREEPADECRLPETPLALWQPMLTTDATGVAQVEFLTPDANTAWQLRALAYDLRLLTGSAAADFVASRPLMVQTAAPRVLRVGDQLTLQASVMNCADTTVAARTTMEIFDPVTGAVRSVSEFVDTIAPRGYARVAIPYVADNSTMTGLRVRSVAGRYCDGEQTVISILPAQVTLSHNTPIFMSADSVETTLEMPAGSTLEFTANAVWECALALPGLRDLSPKSALSAAANLFSAATAAGLLRDYPQMAAALRRFADEDSVAYSALQRNADLKIALLDHTPWAAAAQSDTERRLRLQLLFSRKEINASVAEAVGVLSKLVRAGGFAWCSGSNDASEWVTLRVLSTFADLKRMGYLPDDATLKQLIANAVKWLDTKVSREYAKSPSADYLDYALMRTSFADIVQPSTAAKVSAAQVQHVASSWRELSLTGRAKGALLLNRSGYTATAGQIVESLRQYEAWQQVGVTPLVLSAFAEVQPDCSDVDEIRRWLLTRKQTSDWGSGVNAAAVVAVLLRTGSNWLVPAYNLLSVTTSAGARLLPTEATMGYLRAAFPDSVTVSIAKGNFPAWGGVYAPLTADAESVAAHGCDELTLGRTIEGERSVGQRVNLTLTVDASQPMDYVVVRSPRPASMLPVEQLPGVRYISGVAAYCEPRAAETLWYITRLPKGRTVITEQLYVNADGTFTAAPAEVQSQYAPAFSAHSSGLLLAR